MINGVGQDFRGVCMYVRTICTTRNLGSERAGGQVNERDATLPLMLMITLVLVVTVMAEERDEGGRERGLETRRERGWASRLAAGRPRGTPSPSFE